MNWYLLEAAQKSRILSMASPPVLLFTSCLTPFVELLNGTAQASRNLVNFQFTRSMKSLSSAFWYTIASVPMSIIAVATTPFNKGSWARNSYPESMIPEHARKLANPPTQVIDKDAIQRDVQREEDLKNQVAELRGLLTLKQNKKLDRLLGYEAQFAKALEFIDARITELETAADPDKLKDACDEIYQEAINSLWNLLTEKQQKEVTARCAYDNFEAKYVLVCRTIATDYQAISTGFNRHVNNTINLIATLAGIDTIPLDSTPDQRFALINNLAQKLSEAEKTEFEKVKDLPNQIQYLFAKLSAAALKKAGEEAVAKENLVVFHQKFQENLQLLNKTTENLDKTQKDLDAKKQRVQVVEQKLLEVTDTYNIAKKSLEELEKGLPQDIKQLVEKIEKLEQQHAKNLNGLKLEHENAIEGLRNTIEEKQQLISQTELNTLELTKTIKQQKEQIVALEKQYDMKIKELKEEHNLEIKRLGLTHQKTIEERDSKLKIMEKEHQTEIDDLTNVHQKNIRELQGEHNSKIESLKQELNANTMLQGELEKSRESEQTFQKTIVELESKNSEILVERETLKREYQEQIGEMKTQLNKLHQGQTEQIELLKQEHAKEIKELTNSHALTTKELINEKTTQIDRMKNDHQQEIGEIKTQLSNLQNEQKNTVNTNTTLKQELEKSKEAAAQSQEKFVKLNDEKNEQLTLIETLKKELEEVKRASLENQSSKSLPLPTSVIQPVLPSEIKAETRVLVVAALEEGSSQPRPTTLNSEQVVKELAATTDINTPKTAPQVPLQDMTNPSSPLSDLLKQFNELKPERMGSALSNQWGYKLTPVLQKTAQDTIEKLDTNVSKFQIISENWNKILDARTQRQKKNNSAPVIPQANFEEFVSNIRNTQQA